MAKMTPFTTLDAKAAPLMEQNVNTDIIIPIHRLRDVPQEKLGPYAFEPWRYLPDGSDNPEFFMNKPAFKGAEIVVADENFACGSSREGAVWAMMGMGVKAVIAPSFGPIFFNNCFQNGVLPIALPREEVLARCREIARVFQTVEDMLAENKLGSYAHMITRALNLLRSDEQLRAAEQARSRFLLVDDNHHMRAIVSTIL